MKMWSGRFNQPADAHFEQWQRSFAFDQVLLPFEVRASQAHAVALAAAGVLSQQELSSSILALEQIAREGVPADDDPSIEDVHHYVESRLVELAGEVGYKLHTGRSRNEQIATDLRLYVREQIDNISALLAELAGGLVQQAEAAGNCAMPAYTHLQRAEPVLAAHWLLAYAEMFLRDQDRLADCRKRVNLCPLGSGAVAGTFLPLDRWAMSRQLDFDGVTANSMDATSDRDFAIEFVQALSLLAVHLSRWAEEFILFATVEYGFVQLPEQFSTGSSAMPQKKNPDALELIRGKAGRICGAAMTLLMTLKSLPLAYNKDMQETQQPVFEAAREMTAMLQVAAGFVRAVGFDYERMQQAAATGCMNATAAAAYLVEQGMPFRRAHELVGKAVRTALAQGCELEQLSEKQLAECGIEAGAAFYEALTLANVLAVHDVIGGTAPARVSEALYKIKQKLSAGAGVAHACA